MITRRNFLASASTAIICAPPVVRAANLMPLRDTVLPLAAPHFVLPPAPAALQFGFCQRLAVGLHLPHITQLQNEGLALHQIASELNRRGPKPWKDEPWDLQYVTSILKLDEQIKRADEYLRLKR